MAWERLPNSLGSRDDATQGRRDADQGLGSVVNVLRLRGGTLDPSADDEPHQIAVCHRQSPDEEDQRRWLAERWFGDGVQAVVIC